ncbi:MAG: hypothetical protein ACRDN8_05395, partial [Thermoleophilaceae bacterium]
QRESARRPVGTISSASDITDTRIQTASHKGVARAGSAGQGNHRFASVLLFDDSSTLSPIRKPWTRFCFGGKQH